MSSTACESEALDRLIAPWAAKIARSSGTTVEAIVANAENVRAALNELEPHGRRARQLLALRSGLTRPMMSKLETIGRHAQLLRHMAPTLPPSVSSLYALARKPWPEFKRAVMMDLRGKSRAEIKALFAPPSPPKPKRKLMSILVPPDLDETARCRLMADIEAALARISEAHGIALAVSPPASRKESTAQDIGNEPEPGPEEQDEQAQNPMHDAGHDAGNMRRRLPDRADAAGERDKGPGFSPVKKSEIQCRPGRAEFPPETVSGYGATPPLPPPRRHRRADGAPAPS